MKASTSSRSSSHKRKSSTNSKVIQRTFSFDLDDEHLPTYFNLATNGVNAFRILLIGKSGSGKSTLVNEVFDFDEDGGNVNHFSVGEHVIDTPILSSNNKALILHDSKGLESGSEINLKIISEFVKKRKEGSINEQVHGIWYCVEIPVGGERLFEGGDIKLLESMKQSNDKIPIIVVFTKLDRLQFQVKRRLKKEYVQNGLSVPAATTRAQEEYMNSSKEMYTKSCIDVLDSISVLKDWVKYTFVSSKQPSTIVNLIELTTSMFSTSESLSILWARAQMADVYLKVTLSLRAAKNMFRLGVAETGGARKYSVMKVLKSIHSDIVGIWNIKDPKGTLVSEKMRTLMRKLFIEPILSPGMDTAAGTSGFESQTSQIITNLAASILDPLGKGRIPALSSDIVTVLDDVMSATPAAARVLISYTLDLTLGLENLYWLIHPRKDKTVTDDDIGQAFTKYLTSEQRIRVQKGIHDFVGGEAGGAFALDEVLGKINALAEANRYIPTTVRD